MVSGERSANAAPNPQFATLAILIWAGKPRRCQSRPVMLEQLLRLSIVSDWLRRPNCARPWPLQSGKGGEIKNMRIDISI
jgi:hypothetical protein